MGSLGFGEIALIAIVALLVFGPDRLPELARKTGELLAKAREATRSFTDALDSEFDEAASPIRSLQADLQATKDELTSAAGTVLDFDGSSSTSESSSNVSDSTLPTPAEPSAQASDAEDSE
jgi:Tat protein translocase TatB subunit